MIKDQYKTLSNDEIVRLLKTSYEGLTNAEAANRGLKFGPNTFKNQNKHSVVKLVLKQFKSSLIYLLVLASVLSFILRDINDGVIILVILVINTGLGFYQEFKSENAVDKLQKLVSKQILVKREGKETLVNETEIVPGDLIVLREGDIVPADIRLVSVEDLEVNESQLTGESEPITKTTHGENSLAFAGSIVSKGEAEGFVYVISNDTELGKIAHLSTSTKRVTQYEKSLSSFSSFLIKVTFLTLGAVFVIKVIVDHQDSNIGTLGLFIVALSITVVPEALPVIATLTLSRGAMKLARQHVIAKTLTAVEDLGNINVLCSDKTGTLTQNIQTVKSIYTDDDQLFQLLAIAGLETLDEKRKKFQSSFDRAFIDYVPTEIQSQAHKFKRLEELPFDPDSRRRRVVCTNGVKSYLIEIGSVEALLRLTKTKRAEHYAGIVKKDGPLGLRHLGIAYKEIDYKPGYDIKRQENNLKFAGLASLEDPLRPTTKHTINLARKLGLSIKILSGDSREVTHYVASEVDLIDKSHTVYIGSELDAMSDEELGKTLETNHVFAQLNPEQKYRIIKILKFQGNTVGYQGDGINDAPALKLADVAIAVNNATDVAQDSADIILLRNDLSVIVNGIRYGRSIFSNINKYIRYTMIGNFGNFFALSALYLVSGATLPLLPIQLILTALLTDVPLITIATDNNNVADLQRPSKYNTHSLMFISMFLGSLTALFEIMFFVLVKNQVAPIEQTSLFLFLSLTGLAVIVSVRNKEHFWKAPKFSGSLKYALLITLIVTIGMTYLHVTQSWFMFVGVPLRLFGLCLIGTFVYLYMLDLVKVWFYQSKIGSGV